MADVGQDDNDSVQQLEYAAFYGSLPSLPSRFYLALHFPFSAADIFLASVV
jgi:hypothetical protein